MLINIRHGVERLAFVIAAICIIIGVLMSLSSISDGYWSDAKIGLYFSLYISMLFHLWLSGFFVGVIWIWLAKNLSLK
ncbi:Uncharacterised protein [Klebsiella pneumoniae]|uniref:Uncharacterized protein n=1 Tax=Klebsiella pneumoniae TaxID=573 RepID=A0A2X1QY77_KLEPN|nr:Uncharacterised protein [Klebsiella pneumoniae]